MGSPIFWSIQDKISVIETAGKIWERDGWIAGSLHDLTEEECKEIRYAAENTLYGGESLCGWNRAAADEKYDEIMRRPQSRSHCALGALEQAAVELGLYDKYEYDDKGASGAYHFIPEALGLRSNDVTSVNDTHTDNDNGRAVTAVTERFFQPALDRLRAELC